MSRDPVLALASVSLVMGGVRLLDELDLTLMPGERVAIVGDSGTGKSLILRLATGMLDPLSGSVSLLGQDLAELGAEARRLLRARCGLALQGGSLIGSMSVEDNLWLGLGTVAAARRRLRRRLDRMMFEFGIEYATSLPAAGLSEGERRRVELARTFLRDPEFVVLDEPLDGVRASGAAIEAQLHRQIVPRGRSLLLLTQDAALAGRLCERIYRISRGRLVQQAPDEVEAPAAMS
jgi:ABC-type multidrug transport system ATPase subunit